LNDDLRGLVRLMNIRLFRKSRIDQSRENIIAT
jgi:hypothetical protein